MINDDSTEVGPTEVDATVKRRALFRGGAVLAGAAGLTMAGAALAATPADAADIDPFTLGIGNDAESTTSLTVGGVDGGSAPALSLVNADGPTLYLKPLDDDWFGTLEPGEIANTERGPLIGVVSGGENVTTELLTEEDVWQPLLPPFPIRWMDTRTEQGRVRITAPSPLMSDGRLPADTELTIWLTPEQNGFGVPALQVNLTVVKPAATGFAVIYPGPGRPETSTVNFTRGRTVANSAFVATSTGTYGVTVDPNLPPQDYELIVVKVSVTTPAWIIMDLNAAYVTGPRSSNQGGRSARQAPKRLSPLARAERDFGKLK